MSSTFLHLSFCPPLNLNLHRKTRNPLVFSFSTYSKFKFHASSANSDREEIRWLREEQRWLREEQRWLREEQRWNRERESLLREISELKLRINALENHNFQEGVSVSDATVNISGLVQVLKEKNLISERGFVVEEEKVEEEEQEEAIRVVERSEIKRTTLRKGSEGNEVKAMQEALQKLGFFSGEEDMEFSSFSSGTERAVKTWQASIGAPENGMMTADLLERLYLEQKNGESGNTVPADRKGATLTIPEKGSANGAPVASLTEISEIQQTVVEEGVAEVEVSEHRVFLLGENRWEDSSRLSGRNKQVARSQTSNATTKCLSCRGEGRLMCTECDGTGEPNIEPQFMEWVDEDMKCPYCEGLGYSICDVCEGKAIV